MQDPVGTIVQHCVLLYDKGVDFSQPFRALTPTLDGSVLRVLARTTQPMTRQQVVALIGEVSEAGVRKVLRRLAEQGMVIEQRIGSQYSYTANRDHILWPAVEVVMTAAERLDTRIREQVEAWAVPALSVELFGSVAAGASTSQSDVDLMVYRPDMSEDEIAGWDDQIADLRMAVERWTGNPCEILEIDPPTLVDMAAAGEPVLKVSRVPISGLNIAAASPSQAVAKTIQGAMASSNVKEALSALAATLGGVAITPELQRSMEELRKIYARPSALSSQINTRNADALRALHGSAQVQSLATGLNASAVSARRRNGR